MNIPSFLFYYNLKLFLCKFMGKSCYNNHERQCNVAYNSEDGLYGYYLRI